MTVHEAQQFWSALQRALSQVGCVRQPPAWRRRRTGEMRVSLTERRAIQAFHLLNGESYTALARRFRRDRHYMPRWILTPEYRAFCVAYWRPNDQRQVTANNRGRKAARAHEACSAA